MKEAYKKCFELCFEYVDLWEDGNLIVTNFYGVRYLVDPENGKFIDQAPSVK